jgi:hypothetical protein
LFAQKQVGHEPGANSGRNGPVQNQATSINTDYSTSGPSNPALMDRVTEKMEDLKRRMEGHPSKQDPAEFHRSVEKYRQEKRAATRTNS